MFERFTDGARRAVVLAQEEALGLGHGYIGTEHLLLGLVHEGEGLAARALAALGVHLEAVRERVEAAAPRGTSAPSGHIPFTARAKTALELSLRESLQRGDAHLGTEHLLLGLLREAEGLGTRILVDMGADLRRVREKVLQLLEEIPAPASEPAAPTLPVRSHTVAAALKGAVDEAAQRHHDPAGSEHLLLWLLEQQGTGAVRALEAEGVDIPALTARLEQLLEERDGSTDQ